GGIGGCAADSCATGSAIHVPNRAPAASLSPIAYRWGKPTVTKKLNMVVSATAAMVLLLSITGCSFGGPGTSTEPTQKSDSSETAKEKEKAEDEKEKQEKAEQKQRDALDDYVAAENEQLPAVMAAYPGVYSDITAEAKYPGTVVFSYTYAQQI